MKFALKVCILAALLSLWTWGVLIEPYFMLDCENVEIKLPKWDDKLDGLKSRWYPISMSARDRSKIGA